MPEIWSGWKCEITIAVIAEGAMPAASMPRLIMPVVAPSLPPVPLSSSTTYLPERTTVAV
jgi:hypothetical protein